MPQVPEKRSKAEPFSPPHGKKWRGERSGVEERSGVQDATSNKLYYKFIQIVPVVESVSEIVPVCVLVLAVKEAINCLILQ